MIPVQSKVHLIRAISSEFIKRKYRQTALIVDSVLGVLFVVALWLTTKSSWWWILAGLILILLVSFVLFILVIGIAVRVLRPNMTRAQNTAVLNFVDKMERVADTIGTPVFIIVFFLARDLIWPREQTFIKSITKDSTTLHTDFLQLEKDFRANASVQ